MFVNFYFLLTAIAGFSEYKPMGLFSGGVGLILGVKNKLRNAWAYFRGGLYRGGGAYFQGFTVFSCIKN